MAGPSSTITIDYKAKKDGSKAVVYGTLKALWGSATLRAEDFDLSTIYCVQLTRKSVGLMISPGSQVSLIASVSNVGSLGNTFAVPGTPLGAAYSSYFIVMGE